MLLMECVYVYIHTIKTWSASYFNFLLVFISTKFNFPFLIFIEGRCWWPAPKQIEWQKKSEYLLLIK